MTPTTAPTTSLLPAARRTTSPQLVAVGAGALVVAVASGVVASSGTVGSLERHVFHAINDLPDALRPAMWVFQLAGLLALPLLVAAIAALARRWRLAAALVVLVPLKLLVEKAVVKQLVERERPGTTICDLDLACANFRDVPVRGLSFVSGHAIIAWAVATLLWAALPGRWRWPALGVAFLNAVARVYLGAHNPLDVVGGGAIGVALGAVLALVFGLTRDAEPPTSTEPGTAAEVPRP